MSIKVIFADDNKLIRELLANQLIDVKDIEVVAQVENGREAHLRARELCPDVIVMDIDMPVMDGLEATEKILKEFPDIKIIALSMHSKKQYIKKMLEAGAVGYLNKNCDYEELVKAIYSVHSGNKYLSEEITHIVIQDYLGKEKDTPEFITELTERELEILKLIVDGVPASEMADRLFLSVKTINTHRQNILEKLDLKSTADLVKYALKKGIITLDQSGKK
jgi:two-component system, NarL family, response regulator NreC